MSIEDINARRAFDDLKLSITMLWLRINTEPNETVRAEMQQVCRDTYVPKLRELLDYLEQPRA